MSTLIMAICWPLQIPPTQKAVLISLADNANDQGECWPSISTICERTCFGRTAVIEAIKWIEDHGGLIADRSNGRHTRYVLTPKSLNQSASRTSPPPEPVRQANTTSPPPGLHQSASRTAPVRQADTNRQEPSRTVKSNRHYQPSIPIPEWLDPKTWDDWVRCRGSKWTKHGQGLAIAKLTRLRAEGFDPVEVIEQSIERGYSGLFPVRKDYFCAKNGEVSDGKRESLTDRVARKNRALDDLEAAQENGFATGLGAHGGDVPAQIHDPFG